MDVPSTAWQAEITIPSKPIEGESAWKGSIQKNPDQWRYIFTEADIGELEQTLQSVRQNDMDMLQIRSKLDFPLARLGKTFEKLRHDVLYGNGVLLLRGLPIDRYSKQDAATIYYGIGMHFGYPVSQNARGQLLGHVIDLGEESESAAPSDGKPKTFFHTQNRGYNTRERFRFHCDKSDLVGLLCIHPAKQGGQSLMVSSVAIHNEIMARRPDLLAVLYEPFWTSRQREVPSGARPYFQMPVFHFHKGEFICYYTRTWIESCKQFPELPPLTPLQREALDLFDTLAEDTSFQLAMDLERGDIQFLNNHTVLHTRTAYEDFPDFELKRHLLRLMMVTPDAQALPFWFYDCYGAGKRGGIYVPGMSEVASMEF